jgi:acyl carrier protein
MSESIAAEIKAFIVSNFLFGQGGDTLQDDESFLDKGIVDSTGILELVAFSEERNGISVADRELVPENLDSLRNVSRFVASKVDAVAAHD